MHVSTKVRDLTNNHIGSRLEHAYLDIPRHAVEVKDLTPFKLSTTSRYFKSRRKVPMSEKRNAPPKPQKPITSPLTDIVHKGRAPHDNEGFVNPPVFRGSTVLFPTLSALKARTQTYTYGRRATPTTNALAEAICHLEGGATTILVSSGMQAISTTLLALAKTGDHILIPDSVYQPTRAFCDVTLARFGIDTTYYDPTIGTQIETLITPKTKIIFTESPGSLTFEMQDIPAIGKLARKHDIWHVMDNTWATPLYFKALNFGVDVSIQAATKYIVGHADALLGTITANERAARELTLAKEQLGVCPGSEETFLGLRGLRTLGVRLERHYRAGVEIALWLQARDEIARVIHPALESHDGHDIWKRDFCGASGLFTITLKPVSERALAAMLDDLKLFGMGYSWGGFESLILPFNPSKIRTATHWRESGYALRLHIGLEDIEDLKADLSNGFDRLNAIASVEPDQTI